MLPALLIGYNRPGHTRRVLESMRRAGIRNLYVSLDGPRTGDEELASQVRDVVESLDWPESLELRTPESNEGPGWGPRNAIAWFFSRTPVGIICEDDTDFAEDAAAFLSYAAEDFRADVPMAAATSLGASAFTGSATYFASRYATTWGWATSSSAWAACEDQMTDWPALRTTDWLLNIGGSRDFATYWTNVFDMTYADLDHFWDYQWQFTMWLRDWRCWHPRVNLVSNIGFGQDATHTHSHLSTLAALPAGRLGGDLVRPASSEPDAEVDRWIDRHVYRTRRSIRGRVLRNLKRGLGRNGGE